VPSTVSKAPNTSSSGLIPLEKIDAAIYTIRGHKVLLDAGLASLYGVSTKVLNQTVKRNLERFPDDFMFKLSAEESEAVLKSQTVTSKTEKRGGRRTAPYVFTEQGVAMLSGLLSSPRAVSVNIEIMRAFVRLRKMVVEHADLNRKLSTLEKKYDDQFKVVFEAIRELMEPLDEDEDPEAIREIGFHTTLKIKGSKTS
jgi:ORF6N domain